MRQRGLVPTPLGDVGEEGCQRVDAPRLVGFGDHLTVLHVDRHGG